MTAAPAPDQGSGDSIDRMVAEWAAREPGRDVTVLHAVGRLLRVADLGRRELAAELRPLGLSYGDFDVLNTLRRTGAEDGTHPGALARAVLVTSGAMTARLDRLVAAGLVERTGDAHDRRAVRVRLTDRGTELAERALTAVLTADERLLGPLDRGGRDALVRELRRLLAGLERG